LKRVKNKRGSEEDSDALLNRYLDTEEANAFRVGRGTARRLFRAMFQHPADLGVGFAIVLAGSAAALAEPWLFGYTIDRAIVPRDGNMLVWLCGVLLFLIVTRVSATIGQAYLFESLGQSVTQDLRVAVFSRLQRLPLATHDKNPAGRLLTRVTNDITALADIFSAGFVIMASNVLLVVGILISMLVLDRRLGLITLSVFPLMVATTAYFSGQLRVAYRDARSKLSALNAFLAENLMGMKVVHLFNREDAHMRRFERLNQWYTDAQVRSIRTYAFLQPTITAAAGASMALLLWFGGNEARNGTIRIGQLVTYFAYTLALFRPLRDIADKWNIFLSGLAAAEKIFSVLDWPTEISEDEAGTEALSYQDIKGEIVFENVWFAYEGERWVLRDFSDRIPAGERVGIVGPTGSGKTTFVGLLMRFYEPQKGRILLDGRDLREYDRRRLRASLGLVQQDVFLFSGSIAENVGLFALESEAPRKDLLKELGVPGDRVLTERGGNLSAGERQLAAFARSIAAKPRVWILDEPTSNMDSSSEVVLEQKLTELSRGKTVILIAHRLATTRSCNRVLVLRKGQISETGSHAELMTKNGLYARLYRYQESAGN
jgi:ATP-binding cassette subfamily B multidrug efflux pump